MKTRLLLISLGFFTFMLAMAGQGGPDKYGYIWKDNLQSGGPVYHWVDIVAPESRILGLADDNFKGPFQITNGNDFNYYWYPVDQLWIGSNGYISFNAINLASVFPPIPDSIDNKHNFISALLTDLTFSGAGNPGKCYLEVTGDSVVVSFIMVPFYAQTPPYWTGSNTFQIILDKADNSITVNYQTQTGTAMTSTDVKAGMENITGCIGLQPFTSTYPTPLYTIKYYYPDSSTYLVSDGAVRYNGLPYNRGVFLPYPTLHALTSEISNMGNLDIAPVYNASCQVKNTTGVVSLNSVINFSTPLFVQQDTLVAFPTSFNPPLPGTYLYTTRLSGVANDAVANNDSVIQELVVVDTSQSTYDLGYCGNIPDVTGISWVDGTGGVGMYFKPLTYPVKINNVQFYILTNSGGAGCYIKIYADNGPGGTPGTLLDSSYVTSPIGGVWTTLNYTYPVIINSGGYYVGWEMNGLNITMAVDKTLPISHRTFEIIGGAWSEYRDGLTQDFMIRCHLQKTTPVDVGPSVIVSPHSGDSLTSPTQVSFWLKNYGTQLVINFPVHYKFASLGTVTQNYLAPYLPPGDSVLFIFTVLLNNNVNLSGDLCIWTSLPSDADTQNDSACVFVTTQIPTGLVIQDPETALRIYPNPFSESCNIDLGAMGNKPVSLQIIDITGRLMREQRVSPSGNFRLERGNLPPGIYSLRVIAEHQQFIRQLIIY